jgi:hypothetical protein
MDHQKQDPQPLRAILADGVNFKLKKGYSKFNPLYKFIKGGVKIFSSLKNNLLQ